MKTEYLRKVEGYDGFKSECGFYRCKDEYPGWTGPERYIVCAPLSKEELERKYPAIVRHISPFILIYTDGGDPLADFKRNEDKFRWRAVHMESAFGFDDDTENCHALPEDVGVEAAYLWKETLMSAMRHLSEVQRRRVILHFIDGLTYAQIAMMEKTSSQAVQHSVGAAVEKIKKFLSEG